MVVLLVVLAGERGACRCILHLGYQNGRERSDTESKSTLTVFILLHKLELLRTISAVPFPQSPKYKPPFTGY